jgi:hypothetical protein
MSKTDFEPSLEPESQMEKPDRFFERNEFNSLNWFSTKKSKRYYYEYTGYYRESKNVRSYPLSLYFGKDTISVYFLKSNGQSMRIFSLPVAEGDTGHALLTKKIESYSFMPLWPLRAQSLIRDEKVLVNCDLIQRGFFPSYYGFDFKGRRFISEKLPAGVSNAAEVSSEGKTIVFPYHNAGGNSVGFEPQDYEDKWEIDGEDNETITANRVNFAKLFLDFLFELRETNTFDDDTDENFHQIKIRLLNNITVEAFTKKCRYLLELKKARTVGEGTSGRRLSKPFQDSEKEWLNVCRLEEYKPVFTSPHSLFDEPEDEVKRVVFKARIGEGRRPRKAFLKRKEDAQLKNELCTFFMRKYDIWNAFRVLMPTGMVFLVPLILLAIPLGDYFLGKGKATEGLVGICSIALPIAILFFIFLCQIFRGINLFKLLLPRLFLGILLGWSIFWSTEELWKRSLTVHSSTVLVFDLFLLVIIFMYIFTDISNRMYRKADLRVVRKTFVLVGMALVLSFVIGFYVIQFFGKPMIENSGFLENKMLYNVQPFHGSGQPSLDDQEFPASLDEFFDEQRHSWLYWHSHFWDLKDHVEFLYGADDHLETEAAGRAGSDISIKNYTRYPVGLLPLKPNIRYIWSILLSQFVISILIGIVLQLLWEDRPITEPL